MIITKGMVYGIMGLALFFCLIQSTLTVSAMFSQDLLLILGKDGQEFTSEAGFIQFRDNRM